MVEFVECFRIDEQYICISEEWPIGICVGDSIVGDVFVFGCESKTLRICGVIIVDAICKNTCRVLYPISVEITSCSHNGILIVERIEESRIGCFLCIDAPTMSYTMHNAVIIILKEVIPVTCTSCPSARLDKIRPCAGAITLILGMYSSFICSIPADCAHRKHKLASCGTCFLPKLVIV